MSAWSMSGSDESRVEQPDCLRTEPSSERVHCGRFDFAERNMTIIDRDANITANITDAIDRNTQEIDQYMISFT
jgi:hypothetical protein